MQLIPVFTQRTRIGFGKKNAHSLFTEQTFSAKFERKKKKKKKNRKPHRLKPRKKDSTGYGCHEPDPDSRCTMLHDSTSDISLVESPREKTGYAAKSTSRFSVRSLTTLAFSVLSFVLASNKLILPPSQLLLMWHCVHT